MLSTKSLEESCEVDYSAIMQSYTRKVRFGCGTLYVTVDTESNLPTRMFVRVGKAGCCQRALLESVGRLLTLNLEYQVPIKRSMLTLAGIRCDKGAMGQGKLSCMDAVSKELRSFIEQEEGNDANIPVQEV